MRTAGDETEIRQSLLNTVNDVTVVPEAASGFTYGDATMAGNYYEGPDRIRWATTRLKNGQSPFMAIAVALLRVLLWHWAQPLLYFAVLSCYFDGLDNFF